jgi:hypothetical protein
LKNPARPTEQESRFFQRDDRVFESRFVGLLRDGVRFLFFLGDSLFKRRFEMLVLDLVERRQLVGKRAFSEKWVGGHVGFLIGWVLRGRWRGVGRATRRYERGTQEEHGRAHQERGAKGTRSGR